MADPTLYEDRRRTDLESYNRKFAELEDAEGKAEALWIAAQDRLEASGGA
jgi:ATP-binding cassette subfamily F protein 3